MQLSDFDLLLKELTNCETICFVFIGASKSFKIVLEPWLSLRRNSENISQPE